MNNLLKTLFTLTILFSFINCSTKKECIHINFKNSKNEIILFYSKKMKAISVISLPIELEIIKPSSKFKKNGFRNYTYHYGNILKGNPIKLFSIKNNVLVEQSFTKIKKLSVNGHNNFLIRTKHFIDTTKVNKTLLKYYTQKMLAENKDTLHIGTVKEFKTKHKELFKKLTKGDSISIQFLDGKKLGERITVPVEW